MRRTLRRLGVAFVVLVTAAVLGGGAWLYSSLPDVSGTVRLKGLSAPVEIARDSRGVPTIFAKTAADGAFALGYVHAQDRLVQMELMRRLGAGRLAEILGPPAVRSDEWMRTLGIYRLAQKQFALLSPGDQRELEAYAAGVNAYLKHHSGMLAPTLTLLGDRPEPWKPADSLVWGKLMAIILGGNWRDELLRQRLLSRLPRDRVEALWPPAPGNEPVTGETAALDAPIYPALAGFGAGLPGGASNFWALAPSRTTTGGAILANDPHLGFAAPILWYLARIVTPEGERTGATAPGVPYTVLGHNGHIAWGFTSTQTDFQDLVIETVDAADANRYLTPQGPTPFQVRHETIHVKGAPDVHLTVRSTADGPLIGSLVPGAGDILRNDERLALKATYLLPDDPSPDALYRLDRAHDWRGFVAALADLKSPQQNIVYADTAGHIGFVTAGRAPIRAEGDGRFPARGWTGDGAWTGFVPYDKLPRRLDPPSGVLVNANNRVLPKGSPIFLTDDWAPPYRAERITQRLAEKPRHTLESASRVQMDDVSLAARQLLPKMLADLEPTTALGREAKHMLATWDDRMLARRPEPSIFVAWLMEANRVIFADELGPDYPAFAGLRPVLLDHVLRKDPGWCDDQGTDAVESCKDALSRAFQAALRLLRKRLGDNPDAWRWGRLHIARFRQPVMSHVPILKHVYDLSIVTDGGPWTVNRGTVRGRGKHPFEHLHGAGFRGVYDLADLARSRFVIATGESDNPLSSHYGDFLEDWRNGRYRRIAGSRPLVEGEAADILHLVPTGRSGD